MQKNAQKRSKMYGAKSTPDRSKKSTYPGPTRSCLLYWWNLLLFVLVGFMIERIRRRGKQLYRMQNWPSRWRAFADEEGACRTTR